MVLAQKVILIFNFLQKEKVRRNQLLGRKNQGGIDKFSEINFKNNENFLKRKTVHMRLKKLNKLITFSKTQEPKNKSSKKCQLNSPSQPKKKEKQERKNKKLNQNNNSEKTRN